MYIELFLLDNILMNLLILRIASVLLAKRVRLLRMSLFAVSAAIYAAVAVGIFPVLLKLPLKIGAGFILALFMPFRSFREYIKSYLALLLATLIAGGTVFALALAFGERMQNGIALPTAVTGMLLVSLLPKKLRSLAAARLRNDSVVEIALEFRGACMCCPGIIDTGNGLTEPVSALPVILLPENGSGAELRSRLGRRGGHGARIHPRQDNRQRLRGLRLRRIFPCPYRSRAAECRRWHRAPCGLIVKEVI